MASDLQWVPHFCLACDKQTDGATYCSESCRLADYEETSSYGSTSPTLAWSDYQWSSSRKPFSLAPSYHHHDPYAYPQNAHHYTPRHSVPTSPAAALLSPTAAATTTTSVTYHHVLSPSSSHSSLSSMHSNASSGAMGALSAFAGSTTSTAFGTSASSNGDRARSELRKYACSLEQGKAQRRRSC